MKNRIDNGYGNICPKNCYLDGQATNCHLNSKITKVRGNTTLWLHSLTSIDDIERIERRLIGKLVPEWNIQRG